VLAVILYDCAPHLNKRIGMYAYWTVVGGRTLAWYNKLPGPPPLNPHAVPLSTFLFFSLAVAWAYWMNRVRPFLGKAG